jgi:hypothetical protein
MGRELRLVGLVVLAAIAASFFDTYNKRYQVSIGTKDRGNGASRTGTSRNTEEVCAAIAAERLLVFDVAEGLDHFNRDVPHGAIVLAFQKMILDRHGPST